MRTILEIVGAMAFFGGVFFNVTRPRPEKNDPDSGPPKTAARAGEVSGNSHQRRSARRREERAAKLGKV